ncbi:MAG: hypothetical protein GY906_22555 [bacterium]|nr:hypothetical protein [bacterium]
MRTILLLLSLSFLLLAQDPLPMRSWAFLFSPAHSVHDADEPKPVYSASVHIVFEVTNSGPFRIDLTLVTKETADLPEADQDIYQMQTANIVASSAEVARGAATTMMAITRPDLIIKAANVFRMVEEHHSQVTPVQ